MTWWTGSTSPFLMCVQFFRLGRSGEVKALQVGEEAQSCASYLAAAGSCRLTLDYFLMNHIKATYTPYQVVYISVARMGV